MAWPFSKKGGLIIMKRSVNLTKGLINLLIMAGLFLFVFTPDAHAYIDPGSGSFILQLIIASLVGITFAIKIFWTNIKSLFSKRQQNEDDKG
jgi:hypothetical protein